MFMCLDGTFCSCMSHVLFSGFSICMVSITCVSICIKAKTSNHGDPVYNVTKALGGASFV